MRETKKDLLVFCKWLKESKKTTDSRVVYAVARGDRSNAKFQRCATLAHDTIAEPRWYDQTVALAADAVITLALYGENPPKARGPNDPVVPDWRWPYRAAVAKSEGWVA